ncbi:MAG TPA: DNA polymerase III subunit delta [Actinomycetota bacterium]|nr:DNA polymerase III subunit delta [Actinomycetota bacterium]
MKALTLIASGNEFLASLELERLRAQWEKKGYAVEEVGTEDVQALLYALDTPSLFGGGRFVIVRGAAADLEDAADHLAAWAESPPDGIAAVLVVDRSAKLRKELGARADVIEVESPKPWETADWLVKFLKGRGRVMKKEAAEALIEAVGTELRDIASAAEQLTMATSGTIGVDTVNKLFRGLESALYTFLDVLLQRDRAAALRHLGALLRAGEHPLVIMNALSKQFRAIAAARDAGKTPAAVLAKDLGVTPGYVNRAYKRGRNFDAVEIRRAFRLLADADLALKGGLLGEDNPPELVMELLVSELAGEGRMAATRRRA